MGRPEAGSGGGAARRGLVSARLVDHAAARRALLSLALGTLAALHEAELAPGRMQALEGDALGPGGSTLSGSRAPNAAQSGSEGSEATSALGLGGPQDPAKTGGVLGAAGTLCCGQESDCASLTKASASPQPLRSIAAALAAPELRCRASWFRELLRSEHGAAPHEALLRSLVDALEVRAPSKRQRGSACLSELVHNDVARWLSNLWAMHT